MCYIHSEQPYAVPFQFRLCLWQVCHSIQGKSHVTITHDALDLTVQLPTPPPPLYKVQSLGLPCTGGQDWRPVQTCSLKGPPTYGQHKRAVCILLEYFLVHNSERSPCKWKLHNYVATFTLKRGLGPTVLVPHLFSVHMPQSSTPGNRCRRVNHVLPQLINMHEDP